jgi:hypothetical protein
MIFINGAERYGQACVFDILSQQTFSKPHAFYKSVESHWLSMPAEVRLDFQ